MLEFGKEEQGPIDEGTERRREFTKKKIHKERFRNHDATINSLIPFYENEGIMEIHSKFSSRQNTVSYYFDF